MSKLTNDQIKELSTNLLHRPIQLMCDGFKITLTEGRHKNRIRTRLYVNDSINHVWWSKPEEHEESKFYKPDIRYYKLSARSKKKEKFDTGFRRPDFASVGQALRHLNKVCDSVEIIEKETKHYVDF